MAPPREEWWWRSRASWVSPCGMWESERRQAICSRLIRRNSWIRCSPEILAGLPKSTFGAVSSLRDLVGFLDRSPAYARGQFLPPLRGWGRLCLRELIVLKGSPLSCLVILHA